MARRSVWVILVVLWVTTFLGAGLDGVQADDDRGIPQGVEITFMVVEAEMVDASAERFSAPGSAKAELQKLLADGRGRVVWEVWLTTREKATVRTASEVTSPDGSTVSLTQWFSVAVGWHNDESLILDLEWQNARIVGATKVEGGSVPCVGRQMGQTTVRIADGETKVVAGLVHPQALISDQPATASAPSVTTLVCVTARNLYESQPAD